MNKNQLDELYKVLREDVSSLVDTTTHNRVKEDGEGNYSVAPASPIKDNAGRVKRVLGAIYPTYSSRFFPVLYQNVRTHRLPSGFRSVEEMLYREDRRCVTENYDVRTILLLLREEGIIEYGKTPLCGNGDVSSFLRRLVESSGLPYRDTMLALLDDQSGSDNSLVIEDDPEETPGEKLDRGILLLSLLTPEEIYEFGGETSTLGLDARGDFCAIFDGSPFELIAPLTYMGSSKPRELFSNLKFKPGWGEREEKALELAEEICAKGEAADAQVVALPSPEYRNVLRQAVRSGVSVAGWLFKSDDALRIPATDCSTWMFDKMDDEVANFIMSHKGYYLLALSENSRRPLLREDRFLPFRKHIVDNGYLRDVYQRFVQPDPMYPGEYFSYYEIDTRSEGDLVRFLRCGDSDDEGRLTIYTVLYEYDPASDSEFYRMISRELIAEEGYLLDMDIYNSREFQECKNPVRLGDILTLLKGESRRIAPHVNEKYGEDLHIFEKDDPKFAYVSSLKETPIENLEEIQKAYPLWEELEGNVILDTNAALLVKSEWPMQPTWVSVEKDGKILLVGQLLDNSVKAFTIDQERVYPWYLAYQLGKMEHQFMIRRGSNGRITDAAFLRMYVDLPSVGEQKAFIDKVVSAEIERKKKQIGIDTMFSLSHTIGMPSQRIQSLLGNLLEMCKGDDTKTTMLKMIGDNFDYIDRVIKSKRDYESIKFIPTKRKILPLVQRFLSSFSSLPFGFDPKLNKTEEVADAFVSIDSEGTLFYIMLDNILRNVHRHGFNKSISQENKVLFDLSVVSYKEKPFFLMSICNNGRKLEEGFTINDFVTRGKKGVATGNTGQGGYDIYMIVKKFGGHLALRSTQDWNFIIDILLPAEIHTDASQPSYPDYLYGPLL